MGYSTEKADYRSGTMTDDHHGTAARGVGPRKLAGSKLGLIGGFVWLTHWIALGCLRLVPSLRGLKGRGYVEGGSKRLSREGSSQANGKWVSENFSGFVLGSYLLRSTSEEWQINDVAGLTHARQPYLDIITQIGNNAVLARVMLSNVALIPRIARGMNSAH